MSKVAFISGASRGIGRATAIAFAKAGYRVAITARELDSEVAQQSTQGSLKQTAQMMEQLGCEVICVFR
ncbi:SDR family NAD(P)-dependent oxidoreductase [Pseudoalteromonas sp. 20-MNA-CIBAN-0454]|uniref:SDR family NAD(P)-dependent oxidoreductase n=1 Tax=Pseudoalteromonas sp. 20-MNA-CIBAN-0454 TaxID=3140424 RepID=UPI0033256186